MASAPPPSRPSVRRSALCVAGAALLGACYQYTPTRGTAPVADTPVRVVLTDPAATQFAGLLGPDVESLDGRLDRMGPDSVVLRATATTLRGGNERTWSGERIALPATAVSSLRVRQLSRSRTTLAVLAILGATVAAIVAASGLIGGDGDGGVMPLPQGQ